MVGNKRDAARAARGELDLVATGGDRCVFRSGDTVYKVERNPTHGRWANASEHCNAVRFAGCPNIPPTTLYLPDGMTVLAMPFYSGEVDPFPEGTPEILALRARFGTDVTNVNTRRDSDGGLWIVDFPNLVTPASDCAEP